CPPRRSRWPRAASSPPATSTCCAPSATTPSSSASGCCWRPIRARRYASSWHESGEAPMRVKICGVTSPEDAALACELGADLIGINFWPRSPRAVSVELGRAVADAVRGRALLAGVFVDERPATIAETAAAVKLDVVQLHGDEEPEVLRELAREGVAP